MHKQTVTIDVNVPDWFEVVDYRPAKYGEIYLKDTVAMLSLGNDPNRSVFILKRMKEKKYRPPVIPDDIGKICEFSNGENFQPSKTMSGQLLGYLDDAYPWKVVGAGGFRDCRIEVLEETE